MSATLIINFVRYIDSEKFYNPTQGAATLMYGPNILLDHDRSSDIDVETHYSIPEYIRCQVNRLDRDTIVVYHGPKTVSLKIMSMYSVSTQ